MADPLCADNGDATTLTAVHSFVQSDWAERSLSHSPLSLSLSSLSRGMTAAGFVEGGFRSIVEGVMWTEHEAWLGGMAGGTHGEEEDCRGSSIFRSS